MGLGPTEMMRNDKISILHGCAFPVVLRGGQSNCILLGPCYVVSAMHGEFFQGSRRREERDFKIR